MVACQQDKSYATTFDEVGNWAVDSDTEVEGTVNDGQYELLVKQPSGQFYTTAGENFGDGIYQVETTQIEGNPDAGYGMVMRLNSDDNGDSFYLFEISSDGFAWIGRCDNGCRSAADQVALVNDWWFETPLVKQGVGETNLLRVKAESGNMIFSINGTEVGRVTDSTLRQGDIGLLVETLGFPGVKVAFDNFTVEPLE
jgi:hypothetical protein